MMLKQILTDDYRALINSGVDWEYQASVIRTYLDLMEELEAEDDDRGITAKES